MKAGFVAMLFQRINSGAFFEVSVAGKNIDTSTGNQRIFPGSVFARG